MAAEPETAPDAALDEDGIPIQKYLARVLVVVPEQGFGEQAYRFARSSLAGIRVGTRAVSRQFDEMVKGRLQDEFLVDEHLEGQDMADYAGVIVCGGESDELATDAEVRRLVTAAAAAGKLVAAYGNGLAALANAGVVKGKRVTGAPECEADARRAGAKYTGRQLEEAGNVITALDESAGMRFGKALAQAVGI
ncbi:MAG: DJ-1/PfpI family protein [Planctomycetes bacterium]|nr:DJ-1/PfpI family protein [Planctomycetota bacterium]